MLVAIATALRLSWARLSASLPSARSLGTPASQQNARNGWPISSSESAWSGCMSSERRATQLCAAAGVALRGRRRFSSTATTMYSLQSRWRNGAPRRSNPSCVETTFMGEARATIKDKCLPM